MKNFNVSNYEYGIIGKKEFTRRAVLAVLTCWFCVLGKFEGTVWSGWFEGNCQTQLA